MELPAEFGLKSKTPADGLGYRFLATSQGTLTAESFEEALRQLNVGQLEETGTPWITAGPYRAGDTLYTVLVRQQWVDPGEDAARSTRPVAAISCVGVPFAVSGPDRPALLHAPTDLPALYAQIPGERDLRTGAGILPLQADSGEARFATWEAHINRVGISQAGAIAALLLEGQVALIPAGDAPQAPEDRLAILDAIAAFLPFGCRGQLSLSTWARSNSGHSIRLCFARSAADNQKQIIWGRDAGLLTPRSSADRYFKLLTAICERYPLRDVLRHLDSQRTLLSFDRPDDILARLEELDRPWVTWSAVHGGGGNAQQVRELLSGKQASRLPAEQQLELLGFLLRQPDFSQSDAALLLRDWQDALWPALQDAAILSMRPPPSRSRLDLLCEIAGARGRLGTLLQALLAAAEWPAGDAEAAGVRTFAVQITHQRLAQLNREQKERGVGATPVRRTLLEHPALLYESVVQAQQRPLTLEERRIWFDWWEGGLREARLALRAFRIAAGLLDERASLADLEHVATAGARYAAACLSIAAQSDGSRAVANLLVAAADWLVVRQADLDNFAPDWRAALPRQPTLKIVHPDQQAALAFLLLILWPTQPPAYVEARLADPPEAFSAFGRGIAGYLTRLPRATREPLLQALAAVSCRSEAEARNLLLLLAAPAFDDLSDQGQAALSGQVLAQIDAFPALLDSPAFTKLWEDRLVKTGHESDLLLARFRKTLTPKTPLAQVVEAGAQILSARGQSGSAQLIQTLHEKSYFRDVRQLVAFRDGLAQRLAGTINPGRIGAFEFELLQAVLEGRLAGSLATAYGAQTAQDVVASLQSAVHYWPYIERFLDHDSRQEAEEAVGELQQLLGPAGGPGRSGARDAGIVRNPFRHGR